MAKVVKKRVNEPRGLKLEPHQVVLRPVISEKGTHMAEHRNTYGFVVHNQATKPMIKNAVETLFEVRVEGVRTQVRKGKTRRFKGKLGDTKGCW